MKIRRYMGNNTQEAMLKVKMDMGNDAVILNTRKVKKKGLVGIFSKPLVEVLAAIDENQIAKREVKTVIPPPTSQKTDTDNNEVNAVPNRPVPEGAQSGTDNGNGKLASLEEKIANLEIVVQTIYTHVNQGGRDNGVQPVQGQPSEKENKVFERLRSNLTQNEIESDVVEKVMEKVRNRYSQGKGEADPISICSQVLEAVLGKPTPINLKGNGKPTIAVFVGPTGVGKTTTIAKIAADYYLNQKKQVALITTDTYRIAAVEQLKTYAEILCLPVTVIYSPQEVKDAIAQYKDKDLILIDTAGRSHKKGLQIEEVKDIIAESGADEVFLVISATASWKNCHEVLQTYRFLDNYKLIFTKLDEVSSQGIIFNTRCLTQKSLSYVTTGQSVPDDIEVANTGKIVKNLLRSTVR